ncbi:hypothetical protein GY45DRAFT_1338282 [Cubamyces sp. BRFM 1775]|nr:hypothetical protein GY45DRAFT_1338282 [Cubamyces sp. BRFM 1775]
MGIFTLSSSTSADPAMSIHISPYLFISGCPVQGQVELDLRQLSEDNVQQVHIKLKGSAWTVQTVDTTVYIQDVPLVSEDIVLWTKDSAPEQGTVHLPFQFLLPPDLPPSFHDKKYKFADGGAIRYWLSAVGVRSGALHRNRRVRLPIAVVQRDIAGAGLRAKLSAMAQGADCGWRVGSAEGKIRRGLWGDYATVKAELRIPDANICPLFVPIPFIIYIETTTPVLTRSKAEAQPSDKPVFPPPPSAYNMLEFRLHRKYKSTAQTTTGTYHKNFKFEGAAMVIDEDVPERVWVPLDSESGNKKHHASSDGKGTWVQRATFKSTFRLDCAHTFHTKTITCEYKLELNVPFPGVGNDLHINMPITVTSGIDAPVLRDQLVDVGPGAGDSSSQNILDLPPAYWDADSGDWGDDKD